VLLGIPLLFGDASAADRVRLLVIGLPLGIALVIPGELSRPRWQSPRLGEIDEAGVTRRAVFFEADARRVWLRGLFYLCLAIAGLGLAVTPWADVPLSPLAARIAGGVAFVILSWSFVSTVLWGREPVGWTASAHAVTARRHQITEAVDWASVEEVSRERASFLGVQFRYLTVRVTQPDRIRRNRWAPPLIAELNRWWYGGADIAGPLPDSEADAELLATLAERLAEDQDARHLLDGAHSLEDVTRELGARTRSPRPGVNRD
jgi:hypothetical protein